MKHLSGHKLENRTQTQRQRRRLIRGVFGISPNQIEVPGLLYDQLRGLEAYVKGSLYVMTLRLLCPCNKSGDVSPIVPLFPRIAEFLLPNTVYTTKFRLSEHQVFPVIYLLVKSLVQFVQFVLR